MKPLRRGLLLATCLALVGCGLFGSEEEEKPEPIFSAQLNGELWEANSQGAGLKQITGLNWLTVFGRNPDEQHFPYREELNLSVVFDGPATYSLVEVVRETQQQTLISGSLYLELDGDAVIAFYHPTDDPSANQMEITRYDAETGIMEGTFRTNLVVDSLDRDDPLRRQPDTLRFTDGRFRVEVEDLREE